MDRHRGQADLTEFVFLHEGPDIELGTSIWLRHVDPSVSGQPEGIKLYEPSLVFPHQNHVAVEARPGTRAWGTVGHLVLTWKEL